MKNLLFPLLAGLWCCACASRTQIVSIVPFPNDIRFGSGSYEVKGQPFFCDPLADEMTRDLVRDFAMELSRASSGENPIASSPEIPTGGFRFVVDGNLPEEGYRLNVTKKGVEARAATYAGFLYAVQTLKQLLPAAIYSPDAEPDAQWVLPCLTIKDSPRYAYRGMHLDVARHFFTVDQVKRYLDIMAVHKLNTFHWHLTDDQGWRIEIEKYPKLTSVGSLRPKTVIGKQWDEYDHTPYGGYYTRQEIREVVDYAAKLAITVIPEVDLPGHMMAALAAYPHLGCTAGPYEVWGRWGVAEEVLCPGKEETFEFIEGVLEEVLELFPSELIHIGGDECPKVRWEECPACQSRIASLGLTDDEKHTAEHYLQSYVTARVEKFLHERGRRIIGWDELLEGEVSPTATIMSWRGSEGGIAAAKLGHDVIMTPNTHFYFDYYQSLDTDKEPFGIGGYVPIEKVYSFDSAPDGLTPQEQEHIIGVQANMWTEYISDPSHLEYMLLPRLAALSEVQWCREGVRDWERFLRGFRMSEIYTAMGYEFAKHIYGVSGEFAVDAARNCVSVSLSTQGDAPIYYTLDGRNPTQEDFPYRGKVEIKSSCVFKAAALREEMETPVFEKEFRFSKSSLRPVVLNSSPTPRYVYGAPMSLVDGIYGTPGYSKGEWVGFHDQPLDATIDMQGAESYCCVTVETLADKVEWVFHPSSLKVYGSADGEDFRLLADLEIPVDGKNDADTVRSFTVDFPQTSDRYLRVVAEPVASIPSWHGAAGGKAHMFVSEIAVQ